MTTAASECAAQGGSGCTGQACAMGSTRRAKIRPRLVELITAAMETESAFVASCVHVRISRSHRTVSHTHNSHAAFFLSPVQRALIRYCGFFIPEASLLQIPRVSLALHSCKLLSSYQKEDSHCFCDTCTAGTFSDIKQHK